MRPHPSEDVDELDAALTAAGGPARGVTRNGDLADVLAAASVVVSQLSTVIAEALLADRPVIVADFAEQEGWTLYKESSACLLASSAGGAREALTRVRSDADLRSRMASGEGAS